MKALLFASLLSLAATAGAVTKTVQCEYPGQPDYILTVTVNDGALQKIEMPGEPDWVLDSSKNVNKVAQQGSVYVAFNDMTKKMERAANPKRLGIGGAVFSVNVGLNSANKSMEELVDSVTVDGNGIAFMELTGSSKVIGSALLLSWAGVFSCK